MNYPFKLKFFICFFYLFKLNFNYWKFFFTFAVLVNNNTADYHFWKFFYFLIKLFFVFIYDLFIFMENSRFLQFFYIAIAAMYTRCSVADVKDTVLNFF